MGAKKKITLNEVVADWLIEHRWRNSLNVDTKMKLPSFVDDAVMAAIYIVAGTSNGRTNVSPKLVSKCLMLKEITSDSVKNMEVGYDMSDRQARRVAQTVRFALKSITSKVQAYEFSMTEPEKEMYKLEKEFIQSYYDGTESPLYSKPMPKLPEYIWTLFRSGNYTKYIDEISKFYRDNNGRRV